MQRSVILATAGTALLIALAGCAPHPASSPSTHVAGRTASATPAPTPTSSASALPEDVLFQITVMATGPGGAKALLTETVHAPVAATDQQSSDEAQLDNECDGWRQAYPSVQFLVGRFSEKVLSGAWNDKDVVAADLASYPVWQGDQKPYQSSCASALPAIPGAARAVSPVGSGAPDSNGGWGIYRYGFGVPSNPGASASPSVTDVVLSHCAIQLGSAAHNSVFASGWPASPQTDNGLACFFGGS
jgi:hypothetical protein